MKKYVKPDINVFEMKATDVVSLSGKNINLTMNKYKYTDIINNSSVNF